MTSACYHCGLAVPAGSRFEAVVLGEQRSFCCPGCQAIAETLAGANLADYYRHRSTPAQVPGLPGARPADELALYDRADVQADFSRDVEGHREATLAVAGITCAACGWLIEQRLRSLPGVAAARLNLSSHRLHLSWRQAEQPLSQVITELRRIGYDARPWQPDATSTQLAAENRAALRRLGVAGLLWFQAMMATMATWPEFNLDLSAPMQQMLHWIALMLTTPIVFYSCAPFFRGAWRDLRSRRASMDLSVSLAIGGAWLAGVWTTLHGTGELYLDAVGMFALFLLTGRYLERRARQRTAVASASLTELLPPSCLRLDKQGATTRVLQRELKVNDRVQLPPGAVVPADGVILGGRSQVDESLLTGEFRPRPCNVGDRLSAGTLNVESELILQVTALGQHTRLSAIVRLLERAQSDKPRLAQLADQAAQWFLLASLISAALIGLLWWQLDAARAPWIVLAMLVATCPCALSLATPTALTCATGSLHRLGLLLTRGHVLETLGRIDTLVMDKTGTLTEGRPSIERIIPLGALDADTCLKLACALEHGSEHPLARAFGPSVYSALNRRQQQGKGLEGQVAGHSLRIGEAAFACAPARCPVPLMPDAERQWLLLANAEGPLAWFGLGDRVRHDARQWLDLAQAQGWSTVLLSGDASPAVQRIGQQLGFGQIHGSQTPDDKLAALQQLHRQGRRVLMVGDGVNDVPVLAAADLSIAMGSATDLARTSADAVLLCDRLAVLGDALTMARRCRRVIVQNLAWAALYNGLMLPFAALGWITPAWAALGMSLSSLVVVLNALRLSRVPAEPRPIVSTATVGA